MIAALKQPTSHKIKSKCQDNPRDGPDGASNYLEKMRTYQAVIEVSDSHFKAVFVKSCTKVKLKLKFCTVLKQINFVCEVS